MDHMTASPYITVAPHDAPQTIRDQADLICDGTHDERIIQQAIDRCVEEGKNVYLYSGTYVIEGFYDFGDGGPQAAICVPNVGREIALIGQNAVYSERSGVRLYVPAHTLAQLPDAKDNSDIDANARDASRNPVDILRTTWCRRGLGSGSCLRLENLYFSLSHNQKPIRCVDLRRCDLPELHTVKCGAYADMQAGLGKPPAVPVKGCIGITMTDGSNAGYSNYHNCGASGFYEGIQVGGEHVVLTNCYAIMNYYGYTFGNYALDCGANHPITLINCMDERNVCLPLFNSCGDAEKGTGHRMQGLQEVTMVSFNMERIASQSPGGVLKDAMREVHPGTWRGNIDFTLQPAWNHLNDPACKLWENDGSGSGFRTRNTAHKLAATTEERLSYYPTYCQQIFDTDLGKMLICLDPEAKKWVDMLGNEV